jgi:hypothetical protein
MGCPVVSRWKIIAHLLALASSLSSNFGHCLVNGLHTSAYYQLLILQVPTVCGKILLALFYSSWHILLRCIVNFVSLQSSNLQRKYCGLPRC